MLCVRAGDACLVHHVYVMCCLHSSLPFCADTEIIHPPHSTGKTPLNGFLLLPFLFPLGSIYHFNILKGSRFEEAVDCTAPKAIIKRKPKFTRERCGGMRVGDGGRGEASKQLEFLIL